MERTLKEIKIGSHVGMAGKEMFLASVKEAASYGANVLMLYTGAPQNTYRSWMGLCERAWDRGDHCTCTVYH